MGVLRTSLRKSGRPRCTLIRARRNAQSRRRSPDQRCDGARRSHCAIATPAGHRRKISVTRAEKAKKIGEILDRLYPQPPIPLGHRDPFTLLVAVVLSAQTTDAQVNRVTPALFRRASTPSELARLPEHEVLKLIRSCGLAPSKARRLKQMAQAIVDQYNGEIP